MVLQNKKLYRVDICNRNTSSIACNEHIQTVMGQQKMQNLSHDWPNHEPLLWAKDGPMSKSYVGPFKIYNHGPIVRRPMGQWRANVYVLSGSPPPPPTGRGLYGPQCTVGWIYKEDHYTLLHTKYESSGTCCFGVDDLFMFSHCKSMGAICFHGRVLILPGPQPNTTSPPPPQ